MAAPTELSWLTGRPLGRRQRRLLRRRLAEVGVRMPAARLAQIAAGAPATAAELVDIGFAETVARLGREGRRARSARTRRRCMRAAIVAGAVILALAALVCLGLGFFTLAQSGPA